MPEVGPAAASGRGSNRKQHREATEDHPRNLQLQVQSQPPRALEGREGGGGWARPVVGVDVCQVGGTVNGAHGTHTVALQGGSPAASPATS